MTTGICVHTGCDKQGSVSTQFVTNRDLCPHSLWQTRICVHTICDKQGSVSTHSLWQTGICFHTGCDKQGSVSTQFVTNRDLFPHSVTNRDLRPHSLWQNRDLCPHNLWQAGIVWQTGICVHTICDKQGSVPTQFAGSMSTQFMTNRDVLTQFVINRYLCPHSLWQTGICVHTVCDKQGSVST